MRTKLFASIVILLLVIILLAVTTPSRQDHLAAAEARFKAVIDAETRSAGGGETDSGDHWLMRFTRKLAELDTAARGSLATMEIRSILHDADYRNYLVFSTTSLDGRRLSIGFLHQVIVSEDTVRQELDSYF